VVSRSITIDRGDVGVRVDRVLYRHLRHLPGISRNKVQRLIACGAVLVNDKPAPRVAWRVAAGDRLFVELPEMPSRLRPRAEALPLDIVFEDGDLLVVNKPAGQVAHPAFKNVSGTLLNALLAYAGDRWAPALVNRLDKDTTGLVLVAKRTAVQRRLQRAMEANEIGKEYLAVVVGKPTPRKGVIDLALGRDPFDRRRVMVRSRGGCRSLTRYERIASSADGSLSIVWCRLLTGRTHQIRAHLAARKWPIVGDKVYGVRDARIARQALHAWRLTLNHPTRGGPVVVTASIPGDLQVLIEMCTRRARQTPYA
jgi:23S rRNA pseudouridine1911/1915/1917 synthase